MEIASNILIFKQCSENNPKLRQIQGLQFHPESHEITGKGMIRTAMQGLISSGSNWAESHWALPTWKHTGNTRPFSLC